MLRQTSIQTETIHGLLLLLQLSLLIRKELFGLWVAVMAAPMACTSAMPNHATKPVWRWPFLRKASSSTEIFQKDDMIYPFMLSRITDHPLGNVGISEYLFESDR